MKVTKNCLSKSKANTLLPLSCKAFKTKEIHIYNGGVQETQSGIKICFFGGNSPTSTNYAYRVLSRGTPVNMTYRSLWDIEAPITADHLFKRANPFSSGLGRYTNYCVSDDMLKNVRLFGNIGMKTFTHAPDLTSEYEVENAIRGCDIVINTVGAKPAIRRDEDFEEANIIIARNIARACAKFKYDPVKRFIHFSANGASPDSVSRHLKTKWIGELEVREHFPEATIIRPTEILSYSIKNSFIG
jgi:hypothetical protein